MKKYDRTKQGVVSTIYYSQIRSSEMRNHPLPSYTKKELEKWIFSQPNFEKLYNDWVKSDYDRWLKPSIDRLDDYKPYSLDNIQLMTWKENLIKSHQDRKNGINNKQNKIVYQYNLKGELVKEYYSINQASREVSNTKPTDIINSCNGKRISCGGFIWSFNKIQNKEFNVIIDRFNKTNSYQRVIQQFDNKRLIREFNNIKEASDITTIGRRAINNCLKGWSNSSGGFIWKYKNID